MLTSENDSPVHIAWNWVSRVAYITMADTEAANMYGTKRNQTPVAFQLHKNFCI